ncbi:MAG: AbrB/MazE/SpoVT family DNA-binding domain-containing protein [Bifidobacteriaceae bacterium]|jgi:AbrB family looped-hinge helix DNA binding protein|nr:AbrB/MazE/SpoVT family DNA-binding domain-containing protein [Bifidobacteriaceae bacterium]
MTSNPPRAFPWQHIPSPGKMFGTATVGERGQVAIPAAARKHLNIKPGDRLVVFGNSISGALVMVSADVFEDFADFFLTKINKLGEHAEAFFSQFTEAADNQADDAVQPDPAPAAQADQAAQPPEAAARQADDAVRPDPAQAEDGSEAEEAADSGTPEPTAGETEAGGGTDATASAEN